MLLSTQKMFAFDFFTKEVHQGFLYKKDIKLNISNKYGNISIIPVQQDSITLDITVTVEHFEEEKAKKLLDEINIEFRNFNNTAEAKTVISNLFKTGLKFRIDYIVRMPSNVRLDIANNFGDILCSGKINQETRIKLNYGHLFIKSLTTNDSLSKHILKLNYSSAKIHKCDNIKLTSKYSKIKINNSKQIILASSFSKISLDTNEYLISNCNHDTFIIKNTISTNIQKGFKSNIYIYNLINKAEINLEKGKIEIGTFNLFDYINIDAKNVNTLININKNIPYVFKIKSRSNNIVYPENAKILSFEKDSLDATKNIKGLLGEELNVNSYISINSYLGSISIR